MWLLIGHDTSTLLRLVNTHKISLERPGYSYNKVNLIYFLAQVLVTSVTLKYQGNTPSTGDTVTVTAGSVATFICMTSFSRPQSKIDWYIDGDDTPKQSSTSSTFDLTATEANHNRRIYCKAYNDIQTEPHGVLSEKPMLYVQGKKSR